MIVNERVVSFINSLNQEDSELVTRIEREARREEVPIVRTETKELLKVLVCMKKPQRLLEVGTAVGFSAIYMSQYLPEGGKITTIEKYEPRIQQAKVNFEQAKVEDKITLLEGDAAEILKELQEPFDMIFMDAAKGQYIHFLPDVIRLLAPDGVLISDNVLQDGDVLESHYAITKRNRTIHSRMREYLYTIKHHPDLETAIVPIGDGVAISTRIRA
ncbi:MAG: O-methyltransferase [Lachnospiraceae bacterium]|nr:O-methyltransferase [Lachnospiraceae bacterium]